MNTSRRSLLAGSLGAAALGVAGCSSSGDDGAPEPGGSVEPTAVSGDLTIWSWQDEKLIATETELFNKVYPNVKVDHIAQPAPDFPKLLRAALMTSKAPDVIWMNAGGPLLSFEAGLRDLTDMISEDQRSNNAGWEFMAPQGDTSKGIFGLPYGLSSPPFFYNKPLFEKAGLDPDAPPRSWPELNDAVTKLKSAGITPIAAGEKHGVSSFFYIVLATATFLTQEQNTALGTGQLKWQSDEGRLVIDKFLEFVKTEPFQRTWRSDTFFGGDVDTFSTGKAAMILQLDSFVSMFYTKFKDDLGSFTGLAAERGGQANFVDVAAGLAWAITKKSQNPEAAYAWCSWITSQENQTRDLAALSTANKESQGRLPTDKRVEPGPDAYPAVVDLVKRIQEGPTGISALRQPAANAATTTAITQGSGGLIDGRTTPDEFLAKIDQAQAGN